MVGEQSKIKEEKPFCFVFIIIWKIIYKKYFLHTKPISQSDILKDIPFFIECLFYLYSGKILPGEVCNLFYIYLIEKDGRIYR